MWFVYRDCIFEAGTESAHYRLSFSNLDIITVNFRSLKKDSPFIESPRL